MEPSIILLLMMLILLFLLMFCFGALVLMNKFLVIKHDIHVTVDDKNKMKLTNESFGVVVSDVLENKDNEKLKVTTTCENKSLNEMHKTGDEEIKKSKIMGDAKTQEEIGNEKYYKKFTPPKMYEQLPGVLGANYMNFNENPDPYHLDFTLYDKDAPKKDPVGVNYHF